MITLKTLAKILQDKLNDNAGHTASTLGYVFNIETDTGELIPDGREENKEIKVVNGLLRTVSSDVTDLTDGTVVATQSCMLRLIFRLEDDYENGELEVSQFGNYLGESDGEPADVSGIDNGSFLKWGGSYHAYISYTDDDGAVVSGWFTVIPTESSLTQGEPYEYAVKGFQAYSGYKTQIANAREFLNNVFQNQTQEVLKDSDERFFNAITFYRLIESGQREQVATLGDSFAFSVSITYMFVQNGINTGNVIHYLDGERLSFQSVTTTKTPTMDGNVYAGFGSMTKNLSSQATFSTAYELPALDAPFYTAIEEYLYGEEINIAHTLRIARKETAGEVIKARKLVTFGEIKNVGETISVMGIHLTLIELPKQRDLMTLSSALKEYESDYIAYDNVYMAFNGNDEATIFEVQNDGTMALIEPIDKPNEITGTENTKVYFVSSNKKIISDKVLEYACCITSNNLVIDQTSNYRNINGSA